MEYKIIKSIHYENKWVTCLVNKVGKNNIYSHRPPLESIDSKKEGEQWIINSAKLIKLLTKEKPR